MALVLDASYITIATDSRVDILGAMHVFTKEAHSGSKLIADTNVEDILITLGGVIPIVPAFFFNRYNSSIISIIVVNKEIASVVITSHTKDVQASIAGQGAMRTCSLGEHAGKVQLVGAISEFYALQMGINNHGRNILAPTACTHGHAT